MGDEPALARHQPRVLRRGRHPAAGIGAGGAHAGPAGRRAAVVPAAHRGLRALTGRADRQPGSPAGEGRAPRDLPVRVAGGRGRQPGRADLPGPEPLPRQLGPAGGPPDQQRAAARRPDRLVRGDRQRDSLDGAHRGGRRGGLRRRAERVRADEGHDRGRCRGRALGRPAGVGEEVRHLGGKVLIPTGQHIKTLNAARLAADVCGVPSLVVARTDAHAATLITSDVDERDRPFVTGDRTAEGFFRVRNGMTASVARGLAYAPYCDLLWMETSTPDLDEAREFAEAIKDEYPDQMLAYNCSPSFNWHAHLDEDTIAKFQKELAAMGYRFQFITLAGYHALNHSIFELAHGYAREDMSAYVRLQQAEFAAEPLGYTATRHQREAGTGYFDLVTQAIKPAAETTALASSTKRTQFA